MLISVIIPTFNRRGWLETSIRSVLEQTYAPFEVILVDDGSTDDTKKVVSQFPVTYIYQKNQGPSAARNLGVKSSNGEWVAFLDSDDYWDRRKLEKQVSFLKKNPLLKIVHTDEIWIRNGKRVNACKHHQKKSGWIYLDSLKLCMMSPSSIMILKKVFDEEGGFDEALLAAEDYDLWLRLTSKYPVGLLDEKLITKIGGHGDQLSMERGIDRYRVVAIEKMLGRDDLFKDWRNESVRILIQKYAILEKGYAKHGKLEESHSFSKKRAYWEACSKNI